MDGRRFMAAVFAGRLIRFLAEAYVAVKLGDWAAETLGEHCPLIAGALAAAVVLYFLLRRFVQRGPKHEEARERPFHRDADVASVKPPEAPKSDSSGTG